MALGFRSLTSGLLLVGYALALGRPMPALAALAFTGAVAALAATLHGADARLRRELRVARCGTEALLRLELRHRRGAAWARMPGSGLLFFWMGAARLVDLFASPRLGYAALLVRDGFLDDAARLVGGIHRFFAQGELARLRDCVRADLLRAQGTEEALGQAIRLVYALEPFAHLEAERYRVHVLVKALLEQGDEATARTVAEDLAGHADVERRMYAVWLRTWYGWSHLPAPTDADLRWAWLRAKGGGAPDLARKLEEELAASGSLSSAGA